MSSFKPSLIWNRARTRIHQFSYSTDKSVSLSVICLLPHFMSFSESEITSETMNPFRRRGGTPWAGDRPISRPLPWHDRTTQKKADINLCLEPDSNLRSSLSSCPSP
jgi:hypothetical protein